MQYLLLLILGFTTFGCTPGNKTTSPEEGQGKVMAEDTRIVGTIVDPRSQTVRMYYKDTSGQRYRTLGNVVNANYGPIEFATNGGMFKPDYSPVGLYVENGRVISPLDTKANNPGNFYLLPNGVFSLDTTGTPAITTTKKFTLRPDIQYATQSGPMLLIDGKMHPAFRRGSSNLNLRNGVGILPDGRLLFAISTEKVNFYDFAYYFRQRGCKNALYLDGFVSKTYAPKQGLTANDGNFGVIIGVGE